MRASNSIGPKKLALLATFGLASCCPPEDRPASLSEEASSPPAEGVNLSVSSFNRSGGPESDVNAGQAHQKKPGTKYSCAGEKWYQSCSTGKENKEKQ